MIEFLERLNCNKTLKDIDYTSINDIISNLQSKALNTNQLKPNMDMDNIGLI